VVPFGALSEQLLDASSALSMSVVRWAAACHVYSRALARPAAIIAERLGSESARLIAAAPDLLAALKECLAASAAAMRVIAGIDLSTMAMDVASRKQALVDECAISGVRNGFGQRAEQAIAKAEGAR